MDNNCKKAFLIMLAIPPALILITGWIFMGGATINSGFAGGYLNSISLMWNPAIILVIAGGIVDHFFINGKLLSCLKKENKSK